ncbi:hypothetical protein Q8W25_19680 [Shimia thalassica]|uniref:hypothetical protein n=1 Tax=Shimia thalassica TaxID=1715693 RepID=UPI001C08C7F0|nr:hypothetical protein [Shimia thalassica]MBU2942499.1 hypothetical protein [Shimia thalassica]MDO6481862.1 hypothetical protein [Shimia thalassica]MDO6504428.1 hypothetical protein [Shimia thalassica]MDP2496258.1 hypothetical protein [Shimia thalassica]
MRIRRKLVGGVVVVVVLYIGLVMIERGIIEKIDQSTKYNRKTYDEYVAGLPDEIVFPVGVVHDLCEHYRTWGLWTYSICLGKVKRSEPIPGDPCPQVHFLVNYEPPNHLLLPDLPKQRGTPYLLRPDGSICLETDLVRSLMDE